MKERDGAPTPYLGEQVGEQRIGQEERAGALFLTDMKLSSFKPLQEVL